MTKYTFVRRVYRPGVTETETPIAAVIVVYANDLQSARLRAANANGVPSSVLTLAA